MSKNKKDIKTSLAKKRTLLAGTRTLLSHIRTSLILLSVAFAFVKLDKKHPIDWFTITMFVLAIIFLVLGIIDYYKTKHFVDDVDYTDSEEE